MADAITNSGNLSIRLPDSSGKDELAYLCQTFNSMLDHLQEMFSRESQFTSDNQSAFDDRPRRKWNFLSGMGKK